MKRVIFLFFIATALLQAQVNFESVRYFALNYPVGAESYMLGSTGVNGLQTDLFSAYNNPALAGNIAAKTTYGAGYSYFEPFYNSFYRFTKTGTAFAGFRVNEMLGATVPIHLGLSYQYLYDSEHSIGITYPFGPEPVEYISPYSRIHAFTAGIALDFPVKISAGLTFKNAQDHYETNYFGNSYSFGLAAIFPVSELFFPDVEIKRFGTVSLKPFTNFSIGYTRNNLDTKTRSYKTYRNIEYMVQNISYHAPATVNVGYGFDFGLNLKLRDTKLTFFKFYYSHEASDVLFYFQQNDNLKMQGIMGDINFFKNVLLAQGNRSIEERLGYSFSFFETIAFNYGKIEGAYGGEEYVKTRGVTFNSYGIKKVLMQLNQKESEPSMMNKIIQSLDVSYSYGYARQELPNSRYFYPKGYLERNYYSIMLSWNSNF